jgi:hypothetical protein
MSATEYTIINDGLYAFGIEVSAPNRFHSVRGFSTELGAMAWIAEQQAVEPSALAQASRDHAEGKQISMRQLTHPLARYRRVAGP